MSALFKYEALIYLKPHQNQDYIFMKNQIFLIAEPFEVRLESSAFGTKYNHERFLNDTIISM